MRSMYENQDSGLQQNASTPVRRAGAEMQIDYSVSFLSEVSAVMREARAARMRYIRAVLSRPRESRGSAWRAAIEWLRRRQAKPSRPQS